MAGAQDFHEQIISKTVVQYNNLYKSQFVDNSKLRTEGWDTLAQPRFWMEVLTLSPDSCIINIASKRHPLQKIAIAEWSCQKEDEKNEYKNYLCSANDLECGTNIFVTAGKKEFYEHKKVIPMIDKAVKVFSANNTDPWYAQTILLIESPGKSTQASSVGAFGPFQLMKSVAKHYGLVVNKKRDDRSDLEKSAKGAAALLRTACIPGVKKMLTAKGITFNETDLWFRLLVLHAYHAGMGNVAGVVNKINPSSGGMSLITAMWQNEWGGFKNESQNYSQIALASLILFEKLIYHDGDTVFMVQGDRKYAQFKNSQYQHQDATLALSNCIKTYENDLVDGSIPFEYFLKKLSVIQRDLAILNKQKISKENFVASRNYPFNDEQLNNIGNQLMRKKKIDDAIKVFKLSVENYPNSISAYDSLGRAYRLLGNRELAVKYTDKYKQMSKGVELTQ